MEDVNISGTFDLNEIISDHHLGDDYLSNGARVSTIRLGLGGGDEHETMVFSSDGEKLDVDRYSTAKNAIKGHEKLVKKWRRVPKEWIELFFDFEMEEER